MERIEYCEGDLVFLRAPKDGESFSCGWNEPYMREFAGKKARVLKRAPNGRTYQICLPEKYNTVRTMYDFWWWDIRYMDPATEVTEISDEEYSNILFEG